MPDGFDVATTLTGPTRIVNNVLVLTPPPTTSPGGIAEVSGPAGTEAIDVPPSAGNPGGPPPP